MKPRSEIGGSAIAPSMKPVPACQRTKSGRDQERGADDIGQEARPQAEERDIDEVDGGKAGKHDASCARLRFQRSW